MTNQPLDAAKLLEGTTAVCEHGIRAPWQCHDCDEANPMPAPDLARPSPQPAMIDQIGKLLGCDPLGGRVTQGTVEAIAALVNPSPQASWQEAINRVSEKHDGHDCAGPACQFCKALVLMTYENPATAEPRVPSEADVIQRLDNISAWLRQRDYKATPTMLRRIKEDLDEQIAALRHGKGGGRNV